MCCFASARMHFSLCIPCSIFSCSRLFGEKMGISNKPAASDGEDGGRGTRNIEHEEVPPGITPLLLLHFLFDILVFPSFL